MENTPNYSTWSTTDLIARVTHLESQLRAQNAKHTKSSQPSPNPPKKKQKKSKPFDPSKYNTRLIALKFAYLGGNYNGFEHHSNNTTPLPTIEEELWKALTKTKMIFPKWKEGQSEDEVSWDGCDYSKCGRTDRGVSAFGQVIGVRVRSSRPKERPPTDNEDQDREMANAEETEKPPPKVFDSIRDELPYIQLLNRVLPPDIRILAWCPNPPEDFSARFNCKERRYRYFFTNPAYIPLPGSAPPSNKGKSGEGWLDIDAMSEAASKYQGLHDFRNLCKVDPSKQISNFERRIFHAGIHEVEPSHKVQSGEVGTPSPKLYYFEVRGSAFLWHQVRHLVQILFLAGQGHEKPGIVDELLDVQSTPARPVYEMASDIPLVLWDCIFPDPEKLANGDHANGDHANGTGGSDQGYVDALDWVHIGDEVGGRDQSKRSTTGVEDGKHGRNGIMDELWALWRKRKMDEILAWSLMDVVSRQGHTVRLECAEGPARQESSDRVFDGSEKPRTVGDYVPIMHRERMETPDIVNARYAARKGLNGGSKPSNDADVDE